MEVMISKTVITLALFIATLVLLTSPASATTVSYEPNSVSVSILVWNQSGQSLNVVGDWFSYNVTLSAIGGKELLTDFYVAVYNPSRDLIGNNTYSNIRLTPSQIVTLVPNYTRVEKWVIVFPFETSGAYKIQIRAKDYLYYYTFSGTNPLRVEPGAYNKYFDAMPKWQKDLADQADISARTSNELGKRATELADSSLLVNRNILGLTHLLTYITLINVVVAACAGRELRTYLAAIAIATLTWIVMYLLGLISLIIGSLM